MTTNVKVTVGGPSYQASVQLVGADGANKGDAVIVPGDNVEKVFGVGNGETLTVTEQTATAGEGDGDNSGDDSSDDSDDNSGGDDADDESGDDANDNHSADEG